MNRRVPRRRSAAVLVAVAVAVVTAVAGLVLAPSATAQVAACPSGWGSLPESGPVLGAVPGATVVNVRSGTHECYDRLVVDVAGTAAFGSWRVGYVPEVLVDPTGVPVPLRGGAFLQISVGASDHTDTYRRTYVPVDRDELVDVTGYPTFRQVAWAGSFEGVSSVGLGVRARLPFRVLAVTGIPGSAAGTRVVVDVAHRW